jgi:predicted nucleic acid-binding protein
MLVQFDGRIGPVDVGLATRAASLSVPDRRPYSDCLIAATALERGVPVVTRNVADLAGVDGLAVVDPWRPA